jgi:methionine biosynthesis protein MetW
MPSKDVPLEYRAIAEWVNKGSSVLDLGCGDGSLLSLLVQEKQVRAQGIEVSEEAIYRCVAKGLSVFHEDIDNGLSEYGDKSFDYVILDQSFQQVKKPDVVLTEALRVGREVIVGFPNFAHYRARWQLCFKGKAPVTPGLPFEWHDTPNLHFLSVTDFVVYCQSRKIRIEKSFFLWGNKGIKIFRNLLAEVGLFLISVDGPAGD